MWLRYRATRRKFKRLGAEIKTLRAEAEALKADKDRLEAKLVKTNEERFERELILVDRILVSKDKYAITDEARHAIEPEAQRHNEARGYYLEKRKRELLEDAKEAGRPIAEAEEYYRQNEQYFIQEFESN